MKNDAFVSFWYGLSYSKFEYSNLELSQKSFANNESIEVSVTLKNTGKYSGKEVVQLYIRDLLLQ
jgi:beta-glucosidase